MLAAMIDADERFVPFAPDYLLTPNHKISKKDAQLWSISTSSF